MGFRPASFDGLRLDVTVGRRHNILALSGCADLGTRDRLDLVLRRLELSHQRLIVDCARLDFVDTHGLEPLLDSAHRRRANGLAGITVAGPSRATRRLLTLLGAHDLWRSDSHDHGSPAGGTPGGWSP